MGTQRDDPTEVGGLLREWRQRKGLTLQALAQLAACSRGYLSELENGHRDQPPSDDLLMRLERALGMPSGRLIAAARWQQTPGVVRKEVNELVARQRRLADLIRSAGGMDGGGLDRAFASGELRELIDAVSPEGGESGTDGRGRAGQGLGPVMTALPLEVPLINKVAAGYPREFTDLGYPARVASEYVRCLDVRDADAFAARVVGDSMEPDYREGDIVVFSPARPVTDGADCFARFERDDETTFKRVYFQGGGSIRLQPLNPRYPSRVVEREDVAGLYAAVSVTRRIGGPTNPSAPES